MRSCSPSLVSHAAKWRQTPVTHCPGEGRKKCPGPWQRTPSGSPSPFARTGGTVPAQLTYAAASAPGGARLPDPGRATETQGMALGRAPRAADSSPQSTTQHPEQPRSSLQTSQTRSAGVQARARLGRALPAPEYKQ